MCSSLSEDRWTSIACSLESASATLACASSTCSSLMAAAAESYRQTRMKAKAARSPTPNQQRIIDEITSFNTNIANKSKSSSSSIRRMSLHPSSTRKTSAAEFAEMDLEVLIQRLSEAHQRNDFNDDYGLDVLRQRYVCLEEGRDRLQQEYDLLESSESRQEITEERVNAFQTSIEEAMKTLRSQIDDRTSKLLNARQEISSLNDRAKQKKETAQVSAINRHKLEKIEDERCKVSDRLKKIEVEIDESRQRLKQLEATRADDDNEERATVEETSFEFSSASDLVQQIRCLDEEIMSMKADLQVRKSDQEKLMMLDSSARELARELESIQEQIDAAEKSQTSTDGHDQDRMLRHSIRQLVALKSRSNHPFAMALSILQQQDGFQMPLDQFKKELGVCIGGKAVIQTLYALVGAKLIDIDRSQPQHIVISRVRL